ncbi:MULTISPECIES: hypothetical protein [unclassified Microcoleus]|uniref:hypothetical protein n=1 Tax=unclassified Microcoleus TaxID=2642155 RepID=UPI002FD44243
MASDRWDINRLGDLSLLILKNYVLGLNQEAIAAFRLPKIARIPPQTSRPKGQSKFRARPSIPLSNLCG